MLTVHGFTIDPPSDFQLEAMTVGLRQQATPGGPTTSLIIQSKPARSGATLAELATETEAELTQSLSGMKNLARFEMTFADGGEGAVISYDWTNAGVEMRQYFVLRLNGDRLCSLAITAIRDAVTAASAGSLMKTIASLRLA